MHSPQGNPAFAWGRWGLWGFGGATALFGIALVPQISRDLAAFGTDPSTGVRAFVLDAALAVLAVLLAVRLLQAAGILGRTGSGDATARAAQVGALLVGGLGLRMLLAGQWTGLLELAAALFGLLAAGTWLTGHLGREARVWLWATLAILAHTVATLDDAASLAAWTLPPHPLALLLASAALLAHALLLGARGHGLARLVASVAVMVAAVAAASQGLEVLGATPWNDLGAIPADAAVETGVRALAWTTVLAAVVLGIGCAIRVAADTLPTLYAGGLAELKAGHCTACGAATPTGAAYCPGCGNHATP
ncbi:MAG: hypothetical protein QOD77_711 [Thermoplasmata archaeon]|jgi:hypothetical protein|nr:hypothetical protein [Thermoplasmata archaeon]